MRNDLSSGPRQSSWKLLTNHAHVLVVINRNPDARQTDISQAVGITTGAVQRIINELEAAGFISAERRGRRNHYTVNYDQNLRHPLESERTVGDLINSIEL